MGMAYWLNLRYGENIESDENDLSEICRLTETLDKICNKIGVKEISDFIDSTEAVRDCSDDTDYAEEDQDLYDEGKRPYPLDKMKWYSVSDGLQTITELNNYIKNEPSSLKLNQERLESLSGEFAEILSILEKSNKNCQGFHLEILT